MILRQVHTIRFSGKRFLCQWTALEVEEVIEWTKATPSEGAFGQRSMGRHFWSTFPLDLQWPHLALGCCFVILWHLCLGCMSNCRNGIKVWHGWGGSLPCCIYVDCWSNGCAGMEAAVKYSTRLLMQGHLRQWPLPVQEHQLVILTWIPSRLVKVVKLSYVPGMHWFGIWAMALSSSLPSPLSFSTIFSQFP